MGFNDEKPNRSMHKTNAELSKGQKVIGVYTITWTSKAKVNWWWRWKINIELYNDNAWKFNQNHSGRISKKHGTKLSHDTR